MKLVFIILLLFNSIPYFGQTTFFNSYGGAGNDYGKSIITTIDTAYAVVGATESFGNGNTDMYLFKIDSLGNLLWSKTFGGSNIEWGMDLKQTIDTGYILTGYSNSQSWDYNIYVVKTDSIGDSIWTRTYGGNDWDFSYSIENTSDTGYIIAGETFSYGSGISDGYAIKLDSLGDTLWTKTFGGPGKDVFRDVIETKSGDLLFAGSTSTAEGDTDYWLVKTDHLGNELWQFTAGDSLNEIANSVVDLIDSNYYFIGTKESITGTGLILEYHKLYKDGTYSNGNYYDHPLDETGKFILQYQNTSNVHLGGSSSSNSTSGFNVNNLLIGDNGYGLAYSTDGTYDNDITESADTTADYGIIIVGTTSGTANGLNSVFVMKKDSLMNTPSAITDIMDATILPDPITEPIFHIYPNPTNNFIIIEANKKIENETYEIYDISGKIVQNGRINSNQIDVSILKSGVYFISLYSTSSTHLKFTKTE